MTPDKILYTARATATGGRDGRAVSSDQVLDVKLATPRELGGAGGPGTNPEQLFAAGYSACFLSAQVCRRQGARCTACEQQCNRHRRHRTGRKRIRAGC
jgi:Ohr subfamily peroxiredoxin